MKEIKKEVTITKTEIKGYEAEDGTIFEIKEECEKYEKTCQCVLQAALKKLVVAETSMYSLFEELAPCDTDILLVKINSADDLDTVNKVLQYYRHNLIESKYIGKIIMIEYYEYYPLGTFDEYLESFRDSYEKCLEKGTEE